MLITCVDAKTWADFDLADIEFTEFWSLLCINSYISNTTLKSFVVYRIGFQSE